MNLNVYKNEIAKRINLQDGNSLVLLDRLAKESTYGSLQCARNIFLVEHDEKVIWQIYTDFDIDGGSFTNILLDENILKAFRWDGGMYEIDLKTGKASPAQLLK